MRTSPGPRRSPPWPLPAGGWRAGIFPAGRPGGSGRAAHHFPAIRAGWPRGSCGGRRHRSWRFVERSVVAVISNRLDRATFHGLDALGDLVLVLGLLVDERVALVIRAGEILRGSLAAKVTVDALAIDVEFPCDVFGVLVFAISHESIGV